jgi:hypothetical protein
MDIRKKMVKGFTSLNTFSCVFGGISFFRISEMDNEYKDLVL